LRVLIVDHEPVIAAPVEHELEQLGWIFAGMTSTGDLGRPLRRSQARPPLKLCRLNAPPSEAEPTSGVNRRSESQIKRA
jgi:hypothetical protein